MSMRLNIWARWVVADAFRDCPALQCRHSGAYPCLVVDAVLFEERDKVLVDVHQAATAARAERTRKQ